LAEETNEVKFILALGYVVEECGSWECMEYDTHIEIVGKVDTSRLKDIII
jgi:hypothetical protein